MKSLAALEARALLSAKAAPAFDPPVRRRGEAYYRSRKVSISLGTENFVDAVVRGTEKYTVLLSLERKRLVVFCSCPYFEDVDLCKHLWATILAAEAEGHLADAARVDGALPITQSTDEEILGRDMTVNDADPEEIEDDLDEEAAEHLDGLDEESGDEGEVWEEDAEEEEESDRRRRGSSSLPRPLGHRPRPLGWRATIASLRRGAEASRYPEPASTSWPSGQQLLYVLGLTEEVPESPLTVETWIRRRKANGDLGNPTRKNIPASEVARVPDVDDRRILSLLYG
ncbi:MAG: SWIM zinc finger family protein, partial [Candidatus Binatia bacterium]